MFRFLYLWLSIEFWQFMSWACPPKRCRRRMKYFAFGANLNNNVLIHKRKIVPLSEKPITLQDHEFSFSMPGPFEGVGFANVVEKKGHQVYGRLYEFSWIDAKRMDFFEAAFIADGYQRVWVEQDGDRFYFYGAHQHTQHLKPTQEYVDKILKGIQHEEHVPKAFIEHLKSIETLNTRKRKLTGGFFIHQRKWLPKFINKKLAQLDQKLMFFFMFKILHQSPWIKLINVKKR